MSSPNKDRSALLNKVGEYLAIKPWCTSQQAVSRTGQMRWRPTSVIYSAERGDLAHSFTVIDEGTASRITGHLRVRYWPG